MCEKENTPYETLTILTASVKKEERTKFVQDSLCFLLAVLRGLEGDEFTQGFLEAGSKDDLKLILEKEK